MPRDYFERAAASRVEIALGLLTLCGAQLQLLRSDMVAPVEACPVSSVYMSAHARSTCFLCIVTGSQSSRHPTLPVHSWLLRLAHVQGLSCGLCPANGIAVARSLWVLENQQHDTKRHERRQTSRSTSCAAQRLRAH
ncbi:hypothetical protein LIA77_01131 [Sarocladium implicatum]|nr:hypothetical protein LIA77_01131 [Sarocladium implicatum]